MIKTLLDYLNDKIFSVNEDAERDYKFVVRKPQQTSFQRPPISLETYLMASGMIYRSVPTMFCEDEFETSVESQEAQNLRSI